jgi:hypothetical protein
MASWLHQHFKSRVRDKEMASQSGRAMSIRSEVRFDPWLREPFSPTLRMSRAEANAADLQREE